MKISEDNQKHTSTIGILAFVLAGSIFVTNSQFALEPPQQAIAQGQPEEPAVGGKIVQQGTVTSDVDPLKGHEGHQGSSDSSTKK